jgi:secretion/DNA translocation related TadE-like protein
VRQKNGPLVIGNKTGSVWGHIRGENGAGTILALAVVSLSVTLLIISQAQAFNLLANLRLQAVADSIAIAAADSLRGLSLGFPCEVAEEMSAANMANLVECRIVGLEVFITVHSGAVGIVLIAKARAGPSF